jgi:hypothetical protein
MPIDNLAKWTILPNWRQPVVERLSWLSAVLTSDSGAEQRFGLRWSPRRSFEPIFTVTGRVRALLDVSLAAAGAAEWYVPVWHDGNVLTAPLSLGAASITTDTAFREFKVGGYVMLRENEFTAEVHEVTSVGSGTVGIDPVTSREWPIGTRVFPCVRARVGDIPELSRKTGTVFEGGIRFDISTDNDWSDVAATIDLPTYLGYRVLTQRPNRREDLSLRYERMIEDLDNDVGLTLRRDVSGLAFPVQSHSWLRLGREEQAKLRALLYDLSGRVTPLWVPTFDDDLLLADDVDDADTTLLIHTAGLDAFGVPFSGREHICILLRDGTHIFRQITGVVASGDTETVTLSAAVGQTFTRREVHSVSFMSLCRQNADEVEFNHVTDAGNATEVTVSFRHAPDIRSATDIGIPLIGDTAMNDGPCPCIPGFEWISEPFDGPATTIYDFPLSLRATGMRGATASYRETFPGDGIFVSTVNEGDSVSDHVGPVQAPSTSFTYGSATAIPIPACDDLPDGGMMLIQSEAYSSAFFGVTSGLWARTYDDEWNLVAGPTLIAGGDITVEDSFSFAILLGAQFYGLVDGDVHVDLVYGPSLIPLNGNIVVRRINAYTHATVISAVSLTTASANYYSTEFHRFARAGSNGVFPYVRKVGSDPIQACVAVVGSDLSVVAGEIVVEDYTPSGFNDYAEQTFTRVASLPGGNFLVGWIRNLGGSVRTGREFRVRAYDSTGTPLGPSQVLITGGPIFEEYYDPPRITEEAVSRDVKWFTLTADGNFMVVAETIADNPDEVTGDHDMWQQMTLFQNVGGTWTQITTFRPNPDYYQFREWLNPPFMRVERMNDGTFLAIYDYETETTYQTLYRRFTVNTCG